VGNEWSQFHHNAISMATRLISMAETKQFQATTNKTKLCGRMPFSFVVGRVDLGLCQQEGDGDGEC